MDFGWEDVRVADVASQCCCWRGGLFIHRFKIVEVSLMIKVSFSMAVPFSKEVSQVFKGGSLLSLRK